MDYKITMGGVREDHIIHYVEISTNRQISVAVDIKFGTFGKKAKLYLLSFRAWNPGGVDMMLTDYAIVLKRVYAFLTSEGFKVEFDAENPGFILLPFA